MEVKPEDLRCSRCNRRVGDDPNGVVGWNLMYRKGVVVWVLCPGDQTPEGNAEAEINEATLDYSEDAQGRAIGLPKINPFKKP
jgi:hypothetical protein